MKRFMTIILTLAILASCSCAFADSLQKTASETAVPPQAPSDSDEGSLPKSDDFMAELKTRLDKAAIAYTALNESDAYSLIINSSILLQVTQSDGEISLIDIVAQGDTSARSGEAIINTLLSAAGAYCGKSNSLCLPTLLYLIGQTNGQRAIYDIDIALEWSAESIEMKLAPHVGGNEIPRNNSHPKFSSARELVDYCETLLPESWNMTDYLTADGEYTNVLINVYANSTDVQEIWGCARTLLTNYWARVISDSLLCGRLSLVFYSNQMTPLLSMGISRLDALANDIWNDATTAAQIVKLFDKLADKSDALIVKHYAAG